MDPPAVEIGDLRAQVDPAALVERRVQAEIEGGWIRISGNGLTLLLPPAAPLKVERLAPGRGILRVNLMGVDWIAEVKPVVTPSGRLRLEAVGFRLASIPIPVPLALVHAGLGRLPQLPGLHLGEGKEVEIDLGEILATVGISFPPLQAAQAGDGYLELRF